jgi:hypothetical protein
MWEPMVTYNALVSCVIGPNERFWSLMTSTGTSVLLKVVFIKIGSLLVFY